MDEFVSSVFGIAKVDPKSTYQMFLEFSNLKGIDFYPWDMDSSGGTGTDNLAENLY